MKNLVRFLSLGLFLLGCNVQAGDVSRALLDIHERFYLEQGGEGVFPDATVHEPALVSAFYETRSFQPAWTDRDYALEMLALLKSSEHEGLSPDDYHYTQLLDLQKEYQKSWSDKDALRAQAEVLLTDGILLYAKHLIQGKVDPRTLDSSWNYERRTFTPATVARSLSKAISGKQVAQKLDALKMDTSLYKMMKQELQRYRQLLATERFSPVPVDSVLHPGDENPAVVALRRRLEQLSYLPPGTPQTEVFDDAVSQAVRDLQRDSGLEPDGVVGKQSFDVLNLSYADKVDKLRINLDRLRWVSQQLSDEFIVVNIAGYELYYLRDGELQWETPVMVGKISTRTPIFQARLRYLEFNPTWNAPRSLVVRGIFSRMKADPQYAIDKGYKLYDAQGAEVDPATLDWSQFSASTFPYRVVQKPGPVNAMGQVKFMFPNHHAVYLHDTPSRELFSRSQRAFSAGCIRVKNPLELARRLLDDPQKWSAEGIQSLLDSGAPQQVAQIGRDIDVMLMYWTVSLNVGDRLTFHPDIYQLDPIALATLDAPPGSSDFAP